MTGTFGLDVGDAVTPCTTQGRRREQSRPEATADGKPGVEQGVLHFSFAPSNMGGWVLLPLFST